MRSARKKKPIILCVVLLALAGLVFAGYHFLNNQYSIQLTMAGEPEINLEYGTPYEEQNATATCRGAYIRKEPFPVDVEISGQVDDQTVGTYELTYTARYRNAVSTAHRTVHIKDSVSPTIILKTKPNEFTAPGADYAEEGFLALDNYDGDITDKVVREVSAEQVIYSVSDAAGNTASVCRQIRYGDIVPPVLRLKGGETMVCMAGKPFSDPGYSATDDCDGDITANVTVAGGVDGYMPGTYCLEYSVADSFGNVSTAKRTVTVTPHPAQVCSADPGKVIYLTFDDGPGWGTARLLDILAKYNVKATFFVVNTKYVDIIRRSSAEGHTVAVHTATHSFHDVYASEDAYFSDFYRMQGIIRDLTGKEPTILRFPGGSSNTISRFNKGIMTRLTAMVKEKGYRYFDWNVDSNDAGGASSSSEVFRNVIQGIGNKSCAVVLQHDIKGFSIDAVERIINWGLENGYTFLPLSMNSPSCEHRILN